MPQLETASRVEGQGKHSQDRVAVFRRGEVVVAVVADGAGGTSGGAAAATLIVEHAKRAVESGHALLDVVLWRRVLQEAGTELEQQQIGQTTAVVLATDGTRVVGASVGDSGAWLVGPIERADLTAEQQRKPLLGDGVAEPATFHHAVHHGDILLLGTDGVLKYASAERICDVLRKPDLSSENGCAEILALVRLPNGGLQDDAGLAIIRCVSAQELTPAVTKFVTEVRRFCDFVDGAPTLNLEQRLETARERLLTLYLAGSLLPIVEPPEGFDSDPEVRVPEGWPGFGELDVYWEVFDPYEAGEPVAGSLSDDVLDVYRDLRRGLALWESQAPKAAAVWEWRFHFDIHWGDHATDALRALHRACKKY